HETPPEPNRINASLSAELARIIMKCMSKVPEERFQTGAALAEALEKLGRRRESRPQIVPSTKKSPVRLGLFFVILLLVLGIGGGLSYHFLSKNGKARVERGTAERIAPSQEQTKLPEGTKSESVSGLDEGKQKIDELERRIAAARIKQDEADKRAKEVAQAKPKAEQPQRARADVPKKQQTASSKSSDSIEMEFVLVPKGRFIMGSPGDESGRYQNEAPQHEVQITKSFSMGKYEVKVSEFREFVKATGYKTDAETKGWAWVLRGKKWEKQAGLYWDNPGFSQQESHPVTCVSWNDAVAFAKWMSKMTGHSYRLPTEAEWEYACRGGSKGAYSFGPDSGALGNYAWYLRNSGEKTHPVGQKSPNAWGLYDMHGNAREWCQDWYGDYPAGSVVDPVGPPDGLKRVSRGGSWGSAAGDSRCAERKNGVPSDASGLSGFRLIRMP
ncbi:MAG TPA: SUMF1/EgtB/PvdO family nonheme iron enzyme, partial [Desulfatiglandales bacterium]|nr:SUMF1/EgtB/PvdO family nonheme iron enzyme [Desulfatiglandales bacterium]